MLYVVDPSLDEESQQLARLVIAVNGQHEVCTMTKFGSLSIDHDLLIKLCTQALRMYDTLFDSIRSQVNQDLSLRQVNTKRLRG
jgi:exosome complex RNA-binding protein Rrp42 (RNase PH superfamily)